MIKQVFITGTDTGVGKTVITKLLARYFSERGYRAATQKWIETGSRRNNSKGRRGLKNPYIFKTPCSPHLAAKLENKKILAGKIIKSFRQLASDFDFVVVEGIGGVLVPFNQKRLVIDIAKELKLPVLVVAHNKLGAINHTLLTVEALRKRKIKILGIIFNSIGRKDKKILEDNPAIVKVLTGEKILGVLPHANSQGALYKEFLPIGKKVFKQLTTPACRQARDN